MITNFRGIKLDKKVTYINHLRRLANSGSKYDCLKSWSVFFRIIYLQSYIGLSDWIEWGLLQIIAARRMKFWFPFPNKKPEWQCGCYLSKATEKQLELVRRDFIMTTVRRQNLPNVVFAGNSSLDLLTIFSFRE